MQINFPGGLVTNFDKHLPLNFESKGTAEIITQPKRLIQRLFDNLKAKTEKWVPFLKPPYVSSELRNTSP